MSRANEWPAKYTLADLQQLKRSSTPSLIGKYVLKELARGVSCEALAAELKCFAESPEGLAEIQNHIGQGQEVQP